MSNGTVYYFAVNHNWSDTSTYISITALLLIDIGAILLNSLVVVIIFRDSALREKTDCILIANLAFSDLLVALGIIPFSIETLIHRQHHLSAEKASFIGFANFCFCIASIMTLFFLVVDQTCVVKWPLRYESYRTQRLGIIASVYCWLHSGVCAMPPAFGLASYNCFIANIGPCSAHDWAGTDGSVVFTILVTTCSWGIALIGTIICYIQILCIVTKQQRRIITQRPAEVKRRKPFRRNKIESTDVVSARMPNNNFGSMISNADARKGLAILPPLESSGRVPTAVNAFTIELVAIQAHQKYFMDISTSLDSNNRESGGRKVMTRRNTDRSIWKPAKTLLLIICIYFFSWSPFCIVLLTEVALKRKLSSTISLVFLWIGHSSSLVNPILYFLRYKKFRVLAVKLDRDFRRWFADRWN